MLLKIEVILVLLCLLGLLTSHTLSGFTHVLLVLGIIAVLVNVIGSRTVPETKQSPSLRTTV